jgi:4-hydroxythreonine-4-phosphate dehydrogenase
VSALQRIAVTAGEPAGIGPDICLALALERQDCELVCLADRSVLAARAQQLGLAIELPLYIRDARPQRHTPGVLPVLHLPCAAAVVAGQLDQANAAQVLAMLERAAAGATSGEFQAIVTAPVQKSVINDAGVPFSGHTEFFAARTGAALPVMLLVAGDLRVALATTHLPLKAVSAAITSARLAQVLDVMQRDLPKLLGGRRPKIAVCGLNPHAGESGHLGDEEIEVIAPAIAAAQARGIEASGPWPADTLFVPRQLSAFDAVLAMYHDQGLPVLKHAGFGHAVNVTLGLPIVRTSVDHGTALDLAGSGRADAGSLRAALQLAIAVAAPQPAT